MAHADLDDELGGLHAPRKGHAQRGKTVSASVSKPSPEVPKKVHV